MFKKKPIYIVGIVLFTLLLIADLLIYFLVPAGGRGNMPNGGGQMPDMGDFDFSDFGGQMPDMGNFDFGGQMPGGFGGSQMGTAQSTDLASLIRSGFWPILVICLLGDGLCVIMLMRIVRREQEEGDVQELGDDELHRRSQVNVALAAVAGVLVIAVIITSLPNGSTGSVREAETSVQEAQVQYGDIVNVFSGSGTLEPGEAVQTQVPAGVKVLSWSVENGDTVAAGDAIATVDKTSVLTAMYEVQELLAQLDGELAQVQSDMLDDTVVAQAAGRVKAVYAAAGDSASAVMYENGALLLISLGGSMTVELESQEEVTVGQSLTVTLSDGTQLEGKVQQARSGKITVTTTDDGPTHGDTVTVADAEGNTLGSGTLQVSSPLKVMTYAGTVSDIKVSVNQEVSLGQVLLTLEDARDTARYDALLDTRQELTDLLASLSQMYLNGVIQAQYGGIVSSLGETGSTASAGTGSGSVSSMGSSQMSAMGGSGSMSSMGGSGQMMGSGTQIPSTGGSFGSQTDEDDEEEAVYEVELSTVCSVTPAETMTIAISVDELDILSLSAGQEAAVTLDALPGQSFTGTIAGISTEGTNEGGSTKYTVTVELAKTAQMLTGMNASVRVEVNTLSDILTVPAAAVYEDGSRTYIYTALDEKTGQPAGPVDVTTGSSDGTNIEILSGLAAGDTVYYSYAESIVYRFGG